MAVQKFNNQPKGPFLGDKQMYLEAGIDPYTGKAINDKNCSGMYTFVDPKLAPDIYRIIKKMDEQQAIRRYTWYNLPDELDGKLIERILYYRGQGILYYFEAGEKFLFLPFTLNGRINEYGRYTAVSPLPFNGVSEVDTTEGYEYLTGDIKYPVYKVLLPDELNEDVLLGSCVILQDFSNAIEQHNMGRNQINDVLCKMEAEALPLARTNLFSHSGITGVRVPDTDCFDNVLAASKMITKSAMVGSPLVPIVSDIEFQELTKGAGDSNPEAHLMYLQALDNFRLQTYGIESGGVFEKKSHTLQSEQEMNEANNGLIYNDGLELRQHFCNIVNSIWGLNIWCEPSENIIGDSNLDGVRDDEIDQSGNYNEVPNEIQGDSEDGE